MDKHIFADMLTNSVMDDFPILNKNSCGREVTANTDLAGFRQNVMAKYQKVLFKLIKQEEM